MAALHSGICYASAADAANAAWSSVSPVLDSAGHVRVPYTYSGDWFIGTYDGTTLVTYTAAPQLHFAECDPADNVLAGIDLAWKVVAVWVAAYAIRAVGRAIVR